MTTHRNGPKRIDPAHIAALAAQTTQPAPEPPRLPDPLPPHAVVPADLSELAAPFGPFEARVADCWWSSHKDCDGPGVVLTSTWLRQRHQQPDAACAKHAAEWNVGPITRDTLEVWAECEREHQEVEDQRFRTRVAGAGLPRALRGLPEPDCAPAIVADIQRWISGEILALVFVGDIGEGKSWAAAWAAEQRMRDPLMVGPSAGDPLARFARARPEQLTWQPASELFNLLSFPFDSPERKRANGVITGNGPLVLDDLDKVRPSAYAAEQIYTLIDHAMNHERPLIVTMNARVGDLPRHWKPQDGQAAPGPGHAIASRLAGYARQHQFTGRGDRRLPRRRATRA